MFSRTQALFAGPRLVKCRYRQQFAAMMQLRWVLIEILDQDVDCLTYRNPVRCTESVWFAEPSSDRYDCLDKPLTLHPHSKFQTCIGGISGGDLADVPQFGSRKGRCCGCNECKRKNSQREDRSLHFGFRGLTTDLNALSALLGVSSASASLAASRNRLYCSGSSGLGFDLLGIVGIIPRTPRPFVQAYCEFNTLMLANQQASSRLLQQAWGDQWTTMTTMMRSCGLLRP
jgi:hypothetical protein